MSNVHEFYDPTTVEEEAAGWVIKFDSDIAVTPQQIAAFKEWASRSDVHLAAAQRYAKYWRQESVLTELAIPREDLASQKRFNLFDRLFGGLFSGPWALPKVSAVASMVLVVSLALFGDLFETQEITRNGIYGTLVGEQQSKTLADGSVIELNTDTLVQIDYSDNTRKIILLRGEAHFDVASNPDRPFEVYADNRMVQAVGTAFSVYWAEEQVEVTVSEGRVNLAAVAPDSINNSIANPAPETPPKVIGTLAAGQTTSVSLLANEPPNIQTLDAAALEQTLSWRTGQLTFAGDSLADVVKEINRYTNIHIQIADPALNNLKIGGRFKIGDLEAIFDVLEVNFGMHVSRLSDRHIQLHQQAQKKQQPQQTQQSQ